jgi:chromosome segregation ATPase
LTNKLWEVYIQRLDELKAKADGLTTYSKDLFEDTKSFWEQVLENKKERNITQSRLDKIKEDVNVIFDKLKTFRKTESEEFEKISKAALEEVVAKLDGVKKKVTEKANFKDLSR